MKDNEEYTADRQTRRKSTESETDLCVILYEGISDIMGKQFVT